MARRLINIEEHQRALASDVEPYKASCQSRFNKPEIIAVLGDVVRRMRLLKGTRAAIGRRGFTADLKALASASSADFMEAMNIAGPKESIVSACARPEMPAKVKTALRTLLLSTSEVPGTEGRKAQLRFNGHGNNLLFGGQTSSPRRTSPTRTIPSSSCFMMGRVRTVTCLPAVLLSLLRPRQCSASWLLQSRGCLHCAGCARSWQLTVVLRR